MRDRSMPPATSEGVKALTEYILIEAEKIKLARAYKSIRKKGYYRALKRKDDLGLREQNIRSSWAGTR